MEVLSGKNGDDYALPPQRRRYSAGRRGSSLSLRSPSDMFLFRAPRPTYVASSWPGELCVLGSSVCLALERVGGASRLLLFCHGTSSDLGMSRRSLETLRESLECHVIAVEYPGYGLTASDEPNEESVNAAVRVAFLHLTEAMGWPAERVVVMGRSLGSGPAARLAREFHPGALLLLAPFTGVKDIAGGIVGDTFASMLNLKQWDNKGELSSTTSPTLLLHGLKDEVVPHTHSLELYRESAASVKYVGLLMDCDHNRINWSVACNVYASPFVEMACPAETDRALGIRPTDVAKLSNFDTTHNASLLVACAEAAWRRRLDAGGPAHKEALKADEEARERALNVARGAAAGRDDVPLSSEIGSVALVIAKSPCSCARCPSCVTREAGVCEEFQGGGPEVDGERRSGRAEGGGGGKGGGGGGGSEDLVRAPIVLGASEGRAAPAVVCGSGDIEETAAEVPCEGSVSWNDRRPSKEGSDAQEGAAGRWGRLSALFSGGGIHALGVLGE